jgi:hypothetical protein
MGGGCSRMPSLQLDLQQSAKTKKKRRRRILLETAD